MVERNSQAEICAMVREAVKCAEIADFRFAGILMIHEELQEYGRPVLIAALGDVVLFKGKRKDLCEVLKE